MSPGKDSGRSAIESMFVPSGVPTENSVSSSSNTSMSSVVMTRSR